MANQSSVVSGALKRPFKEQVAYFRNKLGNLVPTRRWSDMLRDEHDIGFMVAGAQKADLLSDLATAVDRAISEGVGLNAFRKDFRDIVERRGWHGWTGEGSDKGEAWRTRIIYQTNMATSYAAGRYVQLTDGGFDLWVYKHGGSREPRAQHLAWDGLTLPRDHEFWTENYPPADNVYGCSCYVVGARSSAGAERLGADLSKEYSEDEADDEVGALKKESYIPGARVANTVSVMAEKSLDWDYEITKAYMQSVPTNVRDELATSYRGLPSVAVDTKNYARRVMQDLVQVEIQPARTMGLLTQADAAVVSTIKQIDASGFDFLLDAQAVKRSMGKPKNGSRAVTQDDYALLPKLLNGGGRWSGAGVSRKGNQLLSKQVTINDEVYSATFEIRNDKKALALSSLDVRPL